MSSKEKRISNFEILRIISIFMIIMHHYVLNTEAIYIAKSLNYYISHFFYIGGKLGVNCFVLISGYFLINKQISIKKIIQLITEILFYTITLTIISKIFWHNDITLSDIKKTLLPITSVTYWFVTSYFFMYIFTPFLNKFIKGCSKGELKKLIILSTIILSILPTLLNIRTYFNSYLWFICLYFIAAYIKIYDINIKSKKAFKLFILTYLFIFCSIIGFCFVKDGLSVDHFARDFSIFELLASVFLFMGFKNMKPIKIAWINVISSTTFGIYLFQSHFTFAKMMWQWIKSFDFIQEKYYMFCVIIISAIIFIIGMIIALIRKLVYKFTIDKIIDNEKVSTLCKKVDLKINI